VVDWVVRMARVPDGHFADALARRGPLDPRVLDALADAVADLHLQLPPVATEHAAEAIRAIVLGNVAAAIAAGLPHVEVGAWVAASAPFIDTLSDIIDARGRAGCVRRCHGDLHLGNLCVWQDRIVPFDALEFDESLATIDVGYDLAFLLMDLEARSSRDAACRVLSRYVGRTGDVGLLRPLPLFLSLRALIRAHVEARQQRASASQYLALALSYFEPARPVLVAVGGLPGAGKSTLARALAPSLGRAPGALVLRSDETRKRAFGVHPEENLPPSAYDDAANRHVFDLLMADIRAAARTGQAVVADATFLDPAWRDAVADVARSLRLPFVGLWLDTAMPVLEQRIRDRVLDASDATVAVLREANRHNQGALGWRHIDSTDAKAALAAAADAVRATLAAC
jgi:predicted kinase